MAAPIEFPWRGRGRQSAEAEARYEEQLQAFCAAILEINSTLDFQVSSRGWCYILEEYGLNKGDFDTAQPANRPMPQRRPPALEHRRRG